jgi:NTP pyrophosphatase (non-canonical NTP hydrolase)
MLDNIYSINLGLKKRFPCSQDNPFEIITRLLEESGELAEQVNIFEDSGVKRIKHGNPDKKKLAKEIQDVIRQALQICTYYNAEKELNESIEESINRLKTEGYL